MQVWTFLLRKYCWLNLNGFIYLHLFAKESHRTIPLWIRSDKEKHPAPKFSSSLFSYSFWSVPHSETEMSLSDSHPSTFCRITFFLIDHVRLCLSIKSFEGGRASLLLMCVRPLLFSCVWGCRIITDIPQAHTLSHRLRLILCTKPWNLSSLLFLLPSISPTPHCLSLSRLFPFAAAVTLLAPSTFFFLSPPLFCSLAFVWPTGLELVSFHCVLCLFGRLVGCINNLQVNYYNVMRCRTVVYSNSTLGRPAIVENALCGCGTPPQVPHTFY